MRSRLVITFFALVIVILVFVFFITKKPAPPNSPENSFSKTPTSTSAAFSPRELTANIAKLSPEQKIAQMLAIAITVTNPSALATQSTITPSQIETLSDIQPGFVLIYGKKISLATTQTTTGIIRNLEIPFPIIVAVDHEGGVVQRLNGQGFSPLGSWEELCQVEPQIRKAVFETSAKELREAGIKLVLGPVVDFSPKAQKTMGTRICTKNPETVVKSASEIIDIYLQADIVPTLKHFPGIGSLTVDLHHTYAEVTNLPEEVTIFQQLLDKYPTIAVMTSHAGLPDQELPCSFSQTCLGLLDDYPAALIITDDMAMGSAEHIDKTATVSTLTERAKQAILAKNTVILFGPEVSLSQIKKIVTDLGQLYVSDSSFAQTVDRGVIRIMQWRMTHQ